MADFFYCDYYEAYKEMISHLGPLLSTPIQKPLLIERLDFRADMQRGDKGVIYSELAKLLRSGPSVFNYLRRNRQLGREAMPFDRDIKSRLEQILSKLLVDYGAGKN